MRLSDGSLNIPTCLLTEPYKNYLQPVDLIVYGIYLNEFTFAKTCHQVDNDGEVCFYLSDEELAIMLNQSIDQIQEAKCRLEQANLLGYKDSQKMNLYLKYQIDENVRIKKVGGRHDY